jgi:hypothetical protein
MGWLQLIADDPPEPRSFMRHSDEAQPTPGPQAAAV